MGQRRETHIPVKTGTRVLSNTTFMHDCNKTADVGNIPKNAEYRNKVY